ncbi:MAG: CxxxxCH/CxxCH domain-containing protein [bacterium]
MISKTRSFRDPRNPIGVLILLAAFAVAAGCSTANTTGGGGDVVVNHVNASGNSVPGWVTPTGGSHANSATMNYIANGGSSSCTECHGSDLAGGISRVSCFGNTAGCHHGPIAGWVATSPATQNHGVSAKKAPGSYGFDSCRICHGKNFSGGGAKVSCYTCHGVSAPHPPKPWRAGAGSLYDHVTTDNANASVCYDCHAYTGTANPNNPHVPPTPAPGGTAPGCFNGTMCHNQAGHPAGWAATSPAPQPHGDAAKKDGTVAGQGFPSCQTCHGANFAGGSVSVSCFTCHGVNAPHAPKPWRGSPYTHTTAVEAGNAPVCYTCHAYTGSPNPRNPHVPPTPAPTGTAPGCFNGTMCHNEAGHPAGWAATAPAAQPHGDAAKKDGTVAGQGFPYCKTCHGTGTNFAGGSSGVSCYTCHGVSAPHAPKPWRGLSGSPYTHTDTVEAGNAPVCYQCHAYTGTANPNNPHVPPTPAPGGTAPGCFNGTMCHNEASHTVPFNTTVHYSVTNTTFTANCGSCHAVTGTSPVSGAPLCTTCHTAGSPLTATNCTSCHGNPPAAGAYPNVAGAHAVHLSLNGTSCDTCHNGLGSGTLAHYDRANARPGKDALRVAPGDASFTATYNAKSGTISFNSSALTCSKASCHGGQTTPNWQTGVIDVPNACLSCHASGTAQYNSFNSGRHSLHIGVFGLSVTTCKRCHNTTTLAVNHFTALGTTAMEGPASATIGGGTTSIPAGNYNPTTRSCNPSCHWTETW